MGHSNHNPRSRPRFLRRLAQRQVSLDTKCQVRDATRSETATRDLVGADRRLRRAGIKHGAIRQIVELTSRKSAQRAFQQSLHFDSLQKVSINQPSGQDSSVIRFLCTHPMVSCSNRPLTYAEKLFSYREQCPGLLYRCDHTS